MSSHLKPTYLQVPSYTDTTSVAEAEFDWDAVQRRAKDARDLCTTGTKPRAFINKNQHLTKYTMETQMSLATVTVPAAFTSASSKPITTLSRRQRRVKRALDIVLVFIVLVLSLPVLLAVSLAVLLTARGGVLVQEQRVGEGGRHFNLLKFRTAQRAAQISYGAQQPEKLTVIGRFLRSTQLDELPQLFNVLRGDLSLVGPSPEVPQVAAAYAPWQQQRFSVPQGITGWWQVNRHGVQPPHLNIEKDIYYIQNYSLWMDIKILLLTIPALLRK